MALARERDGTFETTSAPSAAIVEISPQPAYPEATVLLVDDTQHHRTPIRRALTLDGFVVIHRADGLSGEALCRETTRPIDALVACADMRNMSGLELAQRVRVMRPNAAVLLMCRETSAEVSRRALENGFGLIDEPFTPQELCRRLAEMLPSNPGGIDHDPS